LAESTKRKRIRIKDCDYSQNGAYFVTICTADRDNLFGEIVGANCVRLTLSNIGFVAEKEISALSNTYDYVCVDKYVVMPNHIHMLIIITVPDELNRQNTYAELGGRTQFAPTISRIVKQYKGAITKKIGHSIWQKSYYDHIIRSEKDYRLIWRYIDENVTKWQEDRYFG